MINDCYLLEIAKENNINIKLFNSVEDEKLKGLCLYNINLCNIYMNKNIESDVEFRCVLAEEIGHYKKGITKSNFYDIRNQDLTIRSINEFRAKKWSVYNLIPFKKFKSFIDSNKSKYEVAEELGVTEELLEFAYWLYEPQLININHKEE